MHFFQRKWKNNELKADFDARFWFILADTSVKKKYLQEKACFKVNSISMH